MEPPQFYNTVCIDELPCTYSLQVVFKGDAEEKDWSSGSRIPGHLHH